MKSIAVPVPAADLNVLDADIDVRVWVDGPGQPETRVPAAVRDKVRMIGMEKPVELAALIVDFLAPVPRWS